MSDYLKKPKHISASSACPANFSNRQARRSEASRVFNLRYVSSPYNQKVGRTLRVSQKQCGSKFEPRRSARDRKKQQRFQTSEKRSEQERSRPQGDCYTVAVRLWRMFPHSIPEKFQCSEKRGLPLFQPLEKFKAYFCTRYS